MALAQVILREPAELAECEPAWWDLLARSDDSEPMLTPFWLRAWWRVFGADGGRELRAFLVYEGDRLIGIVPLLSRRHWYRLLLPFRRLELLGTGEAEADEICSEYLGVVAEKGREHVVVTELASALAKGRLGNFDEIVFPAMRGESTSARLLVRALEDAGFGVRATVTAECPYIALPKTWDNYLAALSSDERRFVKKTLASFDAWAGGESSLHEARTLPELERGSAVIRALHGERWTAAGHDGAFRSARFCNFHDEVMRALLDRDALELLWLSVRGEPVAALYNFTWNDKEYFYQSGRKLDVPNGVRPGIVIHLRAIRRAIEAGRREYDFLGGASQYKRKLATATRPLLSVRAVRSPVLELARSTVEHGIEAVRRLARPRIVTERGSSSA
jgi:CelD/BcsL family acetyltransferase involved in cellulose biosynthesis